MSLLDAVRPEPDGPRPSGGGSKSAGGRLRGTHGRPAGTAGRSVGPTAKPTRPGPHLRHERALLRDGARLVAGMDEVGRGSLAGPVSVGVVVVDARTRACPAGVTDSKLLSPAARTALLPALATWGVARAVGHASPAEIDAFGIIGALRLAGTRALAAVACSVGPVDAVLLDGSHDWLTVPDELDLFGAVGRGALDGSGADLSTAGLRAVGPLAPSPDGGAQTCATTPAPRVRTLVKADVTCASVAAASVLAKCERDDLMVALALGFPQYGWAANKGYGSTEHVAALRAHGPCELHRRSWRLPSQLVGG